jgi:hypothetical protein
LRRDSLHGEQHFPACIFIRAFVVFSCPVSIHKTMNEPLSLAAQAVLDAANGASEWDPGDCLNDARSISVATLRAASGRTEDLIGDTSHPKFAEGVLAAGDLLEHIAAELEGANG